MSEEEVAVVEPSEEVEKKEEEEVVDEIAVIEMMKSYMLLGLKYGFFIFVIVYLIAAFVTDFKRATALFVITVLTCAYMAFQMLVSDEMFEKFEGGIVSFMEKVDTQLSYGLIYSGVLIGIMVIIMAVTVRDARNLISIFGLVVFILLSWFFSYKPSKVMVRPVIGSIFMQFIFGYLAIKTSWGFDAINFIANDIFVTILNYTYNGSSFVFSWLVDGSLWGTAFVTNGGDGVYFLGPPFFFNVLPTVVFMSSFFCVAYYVGALPWLTKKLGWFFGMTLGTSASESLSAAGNIFVGQTEAPLLVRPFMPEMTDSEIFCVMAGGFATIAGGVLGLFIAIGIDPVALVAASIMSAPAALAISKVMLPEDEDSKTAPGKKGAFEIPDSGHSNIVHAAADGAVIGTTLLLNIAGNLIAFLAFLKMFDELIIYLGTRVDIDIDLNKLLGWLFYPAAWLMGIPGEDCELAGTLLATKVFSNELIAYQLMLFEFRADLSERTFYILSYALCGFSNFGSIGIQLGGLSPMAGPEKAPVLAKYVFAAMIAGNTACWMTACIAGIFYED